jgi:hypothetical protein
VLSNLGPNCLYSGGYPWTFQSAYAHFGTGFTAKSQRTQRLSFFCFPERGRKAKSPSLQVYRIPFLESPFSLAGVSAAREKMPPLRPLRLCGEILIWINLKTSIAPRAVSGNRSSEAGSKSKWNWRERKGGADHSARELEDVTWRMTWPRVLLTYIHLVELNMGMCGQRSLTLS